MDWVTWHQQQEPCYRQLLELEQQLSLLRYQWGRAELTPQQLKRQLQQLTRSIAVLTQDL